MNQIKKRIFQSKSFVVTTHINPEADAIGSQLAVYRLLRKLNKKVFLVLDDRIPSYLDFFPDVKKIVKFSSGSVNPENYECIIVVDTPGASRLGRIGNYLDRFNWIINIDHHVSNTRFGHIVWVEKDVSSTGEMVYTLYKKLGVEIDYVSAVYLYSAILTDSGSFRYKGTTPTTHRIVAHLLEKGIKPYDVYSQIYERNTVNKIRLVGDCLKDVHKRDGIVWVEVTRQMLKHHRARSQDLEGLIDFLRTIPEGDIAVVFQELDSEIKVTFRSRRDNIDVNRIAKVFGGGGHKMASGCRIVGSLNEVRKKVFKVIGQELRRKWIP